VSPTNATRTDTCCAGELMGWVLEDGEDTLCKKGAAVLKKPPKALIVKFDNAEWQLEGMQDPGTYPIKVAKKTWHLDDKRPCPVLRVSRTQTPIGPDYARTAYSSQGLTLDAAIVDLCFDENTDPTTAYIAMSRVRCADDILIMQEFDIKIFQQGIPIGPAMLLKFLRGEDMDSDIAAHLASEKVKIDEEKATKEQKKQAKQAKRVLDQANSKLKSNAKNKKTPAEKAACKEATKQKRNEKRRRSPKDKEIQEDANKQKRIETEKIRKTGSKEKIRKTDRDRKRKA
jgi:hypothetical protein